MLGDAGLRLVKGLALGDLRQYPRQLRRVLVGIGLKASTETEVNLFPARRQDGFALGGKLFPGTGESGGGGPMCFWAAPPLLPVPGKRLTPKGKTT